MASRWSKIRSLVQGNFQYLDYKQNVHPFVTREMQKNHFKFDQPSLVSLYFGSIVGSNTIQDALKICDDDNKSDFKLTNHDLNGLQKIIEKWISKQEV